MKRTSLLPQTIFKMELQDFGFPVIDIRIQYKCYNIPKLDIDPFKYIQSYSHQSCMINS